MYYLAICAYAFVLKKCQRNNVATSLRQLFETGNCLLLTIVGPSKQREGGREKNKKLNKRLKVK